MGTLAVETNLFVVSKGFPNVTRSGRQYNIREKPSVILYTCCYINNFSMQGHQNHNPFYYLRVLDYSIVIWSYMILERLKLNLVVLAPYLSFTCDLM